MGNSFKIKIKNYQSLRDVDIELEEGLNIIIGDTNEGKSAIIRAVRDAIFNNGDDTKVRVGHKQLGVSLDNGKHKMIFIRTNQGKNNKTKYQFDGGNVITKVGRTQLEEVAKMFNIKEVRMANNVKVKLNFWFQGERPFLTDKTSGQLYEFMSLSSSDKYIKVLKEMKADIKGLSAKINTLSASIDTLKQINNEKKEFLDKNKGFDEVYKKAIKINAQVKEFNKLEEKINRLNDLKAKLVVKQKALNKVRDKLKDINFNDIQKEYREIEDINNTYVNLEGKINKIRKKKNDYNTVNTELTVLSRELKKAESVYTVVSGLYLEVENIMNVLQNIGNIMKNYNNKRKQYKEIQDELNKIRLEIDNIDLDSFKDEIRRLDDLIKKEKEIEKLYNDLNNKNNQLNKKKDLLEKLNKEYNDAVDEFNKFKEEIGVCPYCGSKFK